MTDRNKIEKQTRSILDNITGIANQLDTLRELDKAAAAGTYLQIIQYLEDKNKDSNWTKPLK